ncbi:MAG: hypothetical protein JWO45_1265, partial [Spartobacteria bacterium]|nr:hypothetical protein [Spartobacteria bacterium]
MITQAIFKMLLPLACAWAKKQQSLILRDGVSLTAEQIIDARKIGIQCPEQVRLRRVEEIPMPLNRSLRHRAQSIGLISRTTVGMTLDHGIYIRSDYWGDRRLLVH